MTKFQFTKFGFKHDPRGAHVAMEYKGRTLLGEVIGCNRNAVTGSVTLQVKHFNGDMWPLEPVAMTVGLMERN